MMEIYIGTERLDLFKDEDVSINLSVQNIKDISKVFADYTQNFSVPASVVNNKIFKHYYNADISGGFDAALRQSANIILDKEPFRSGSVELLSVVLKNGEPQSYEIVFFSAGVSLKDTFGEDELNDLDLSAYDHSYTGANVRLGAEGSLFSGDVIYPLISPVTNWTYNSNSSVHTDADIAYHTTNDDHGLHYYELKPAIRVNKIIDAIEDKYGLTFNSSLFTEDRFNNLFMWCHRREGWLFKDQENGWNPEPFRWDSTTGLGWSGSDYVVGSVSLSIEYRYNLTIISGTDVGLYLYVNGNLFTTIVHTASAVGAIPMNGLKQGDVVTIKYGPAPNAAGSNFSISLNVELFRTTFPQIIIASASTGGTLLSFSNDVVIADHLPEQKVSDFINGLIKMFNLTLESVSGTEFNLEPLDSWYASGNTYDITRYTDIENIGIQKPELYKRIKFEHQEANSNAMRSYRLQNGGVAYGDLRADFSFDGGELMNQTTFELLRLGRLIDANTSTPVDFLLGKSIDQNFEPYIGEPIIFYSGDVLDISASPIGFLDESGLTPSPADPLISVAFLANVDNKVVDDVTQMLTFGLEIDPYHNQAFNETLYAEFWEDYVTDLYSTNRRLYTYNAILPMNIIYSLKMNDKLVIGGRRYIINSVNLNLSTRKAKLELLNDV